MDQRSENKTWVLSRVLPTSDHLGFRYSRSTLSGFLSADGVVELDQFPSSDAFRAQADSTDAGNCQMQDSGEE